MSEEDAFLGGIAVDRADRTRLLVFADWLADRNDPREEFVRIHAKLLEMDGTEPEFEERNRLWKSWVGGTPFDHPTRSCLDRRWLDALCRVFTATDTGPYVFDTSNDRPVTGARFEYDPVTLSNSGRWYTFVFHHGKSRSFEGPFDFLARTVLRDCTNDDPFESNREEQSHRYFTPMTRGTFWNGWRNLRSALVNSPPMPVLAVDNFFLGAQHYAPDRHYGGMVSIHQQDYFALFWSVVG
jgi:uncharacterized protein (TIGR02996 family)